MSRSAGSIATLDPEQLSALEISGSVWRDFGFKSYRHTTFPEFDICADVLPEQFDLVIAEHIFEHLRLALTSGSQRPRDDQARRALPDRHAVPLQGSSQSCRLHALDGDGLAALPGGVWIPAGADDNGSWGNRECVEATFRAGVPPLQSLSSFSRERAGIPDRGLGAGTSTGINLCSAIRFPIGGSRSPRLVPMTFTS